MTLMRDLHRFPVFCVVCRRELPLHEARMLRFHLSPQCKECRQKRQEKVRSAKLNPRKCHDCDNIAIYKEGFMPECSRCGSRATHEFVQRDEIDPRYIRVQKTAISEVSRWFNLFLTDTYRLIVDGGNHTDHRGRLYELHLQETDLLLSGRVLLPKRNDTIQQAVFSWRSTGIENSNHPESIRTVESLLRQKGIV